MNEAWVPVVEFPDAFEVSSEGRIRSVARVVIRSNGRRHTVRSKIKDINSLNPRSGYVQTCLTVNGRRHTRMLHNIVTQAFLGPKTPDTPVVRHLDGNKLDNRLCNLTYGTPEENVQDRLRHGHDYNRNKTHCHNGHEYAVESTITEPTGWRRCRICKQARERERKRRLRH